ncbi:Ig-like domain-containing protein [Candidatus Saganbacteria bacterium]|nr:Ig-like domain-containing protein [Candidatus Saganbacteria bacterium]
MTNNKIQCVLSLIIYCSMVSTCFASPIISNEELVSVADNHIVITWQTTNEAANSGVKWGYSSTPDNIYVTDEARTMDHYLVLTNLYPNTIYYYKVFSYSAAGTTESVLHSVTTLARPSGNYLFSFATLTDLHYAPNRASTTNVRGRPYASSEALIDALVSNINQHSPAFTIIKGDMMDVGVDTPLIRIAQLKSRLDNLTGSGSTKYYPIPGNHDKGITYDSGNNWVTGNLGVLYPAKAGLPAGNSTFNYGFNYSGYRFILLDSSVSNGTTAEVNITSLEAELTIARTAGQKAFIFMHHETSEESDIPIDFFRTVLDESSWEESDWNKIRLINKTAFMSSLEAYKLANGEPVAAGVFSGHIHDNRKRVFNNIPYVRTASGLQFPTGFNIYKVYSNGYIQTFYKLPGFSEEIARDLVTGTAEITAARAQQFYLGGASSRNFTFTYTTSTTIAPTIESLQPASESSSVALNQPIIITFTKTMSRETAVQSWLNITANSTPLTLTSSDWSWNAARTILTINKTLSASTNYIVTISGGASGAVAADNTYFSSDYSFSFASGAAPSTTAPLAVFHNIKNEQGSVTDVTTNSKPTLTGVATDASGSTITDVECRYASGSFSAWLPATPLDGAFNSSQEAFSFTVTSEIVRGQHEIQVRSTNAAGLTSTGSSTAYSFWVISNKPELTLKANGTSLINGDPLDTSPSLEISVITDVTLDQLWLTIDTDRINLKPASPSFVNTIFYRPTLAAGTHNLKVETVDITASGVSRASTKEAVNLLVQTAGDPNLFGPPLNYPNPFDPSSQSTIISYTLSKDSDINLKIFDLGGNLLVNQSFTSGQSGSKAGYNEITWDGKSNGNLVGNGLYLYLLISDGKVLQNGTGKITVFKL